MARAGRRARDESGVVLFCVRLTRRERDALRRVARENRTTIAEVIREAVDAFVGDYRDDPVFSTTSAIRTYDS